MKKVLSFVLVLALVLGSFSMAFAATPTDVVGKTCENAVRALSDLGVISGYTDGTYKPENPVNRAEACKLIISALGLDAYAEGITSTSFTDLDGYGWAIGYIGYAERLGLVKGVGNGKFNPGGPVTYEQWATMLVRALGYTDEVLPGSWPANYMIKAQSLHIMKDIKAAGNAAANRGDVAIMLYNNMDNGIGYINKDNQWIENEAPSGWNRDCMMARLSKYAASSEFEIFTDTDLGNVADGINLRSYLGANVKVYKDENNDDKIIGIKDCNTVFLTGDTNAKVDTFSVGDTDYDIRDARTAVVRFANGKMDKDVTGDAITTNFAVAYKDASNITIAAKVSGKTITDIYSVLEWNATKADRYEDGDLNTAKCKIYGEEFEKDNNGEIDTTKFELLGVASLDKIAEDNIVEVFTDGKYIRRVTVGTTVVEGDITKVNSENTKYTINGTTYKVAPIFMGDELKLAEGGKAYLNYDGKISDWEATSGVADNYAVLLGAHTDSKYGDYTDSVKLFTKEGKEVAFDLDEGVTLTGLGIVKNDLIKYGLNSKGEIDSITVTSIANGQNVGSDGKANSKGTTIGGRSVADDIVVFIFDGNDWDLGSVKDFDTKKSVGANLAAGANYYADIDGKKVAAIALSDSINGDNFTYGVIDSVYSTTNDSNEKYWAIDGFGDGKELTKVFTDTKTTQKTIGQMNAAGFDQATTTGGLQQLKIKGGELTAVTYGALALDNDSVTYVTNGNQGYQLTKVNRSKNELTLATGGDGSVYTLDAKAVVYKWNTNDGEWTLTDISGLSQEDWVKLYKEDDDNLDGHNIVLAWDNDANF